MDRLTERIGKYYIGWKGNKDFTTKERYYTLMERMAEIEDKIGTGQIIEPPCGYGAIIPIEKAHDPATCPACTRDGGELYCTYIKSLCGVTNCPQIPTIYEKA
jgi:hypothetical protein